MPSRNLPNPAFIFTKPFQFEFYSKMKMEDKERKEANKKYERARKEELGLPDSSPEEEENAGGAGMATNNFLIPFVFLLIKNVVVFDSFRQILISLLLEPSKAF